MNLLKMSFCCLPSNTVRRMSFSILPRVFMLFFFAVYVHEQVHDDVVSVYREQKRRATDMKLLSGICICNVIFLYVPNYEEVVVVAVEKERIDVDVEMRVDNRAVERE